MNKGTKAKWFFIGLSTGWTLLIIAGLVLFNLVDQDDPFNGVRPDMGESLHEFGRESLWQSSHMRLGNSGFTASAGPVRYEDEDNTDWDYYSIDIEKSDGKASYVYFQRDFKTDEIPKSLLNMKVMDIAIFDEESRVVTFDIGDKKFTYTLPNR